MRSTIIFILISLAFLSTSAQERWVKHLPGWTARQSFLRGDTLFSFGMNNGGSSRILTFINGCALNGGSLFNSIINIDTIEMNPNRSTVLSSYQTVMMEGNQFVVGLNLLGDYKKSTCFLDFVNKKNHVLHNLSFDTFSTYSSGIVKIGKSYYIAGDYRYYEDALNSLPVTYILKWSADSKNYLRSYKAKPGALGWDWVYEDMLKDDLNFDTYFVILSYKADYTGSPNTWDDYIIKMDTLGNELWRCMPNNRDSINTAGMQMIQKSNGNLLVSWSDYYYRRGKNPQGSTSIMQGNDNCKVWFAEIDTVGKVLWRKNISGYLAQKLNRDSYHNLVHKKVIKTSSGCLWSGYYNWAYTHSYLLKTDFEGNPIWYREYNLHPDNNARQDFKPYDITPTPDGGYVITGEYISNPGNLYPQGCQLATIVKVDSFGCLAPGCQLASVNKFPVQRDYELASLYPNPANSVLRIEFQKKFPYQVLLYNNLGQLVSEYSNTGTGILDIHSFSNGLYLLKIINKESGNIQTHKVQIRK
ncbi:MAG: T9SS type A sorting domain-containing protein [Bacteroidia bacterium]|nr:T9SS type A sorting domain-containing protein [Bacteroidia bacterium]